jgi:hypothetical protein
MKGLNSQRLLGVIEENDFKVQELKDGFEGSSVLFKVGIYSQPPGIFSDLCFMLRM